MLWCPPPPDVGQTHLQVEARGYLRAALDHMVMMGDEEARATRELEALAAVDGRNAVEWAGKGRGGGFDVPRAGGRSREEAAPGVG